MIDVLASERQFIDHTLPVWRALPAKLRGTFYTGDPSLLPYLSARDVAGVLWRRRALDVDGTLLVASIGDCNRTRRAGSAHVVYMEHGVGQSYAGDKRTARHHSYAGGDGREHVAMILAPNEQAATRWRDRYPEMPVHVIGATRLLPAPSGDEDAAPTLAISFHWSGPIPEMRNALTHYSRELPALARRFNVIGHGHPRFAGTLQKVYQRARIEFVADVEEVARRASVYAVDNSSTLWELGRTRPVIALDAPWYRRYVFHGLRFWDAIPGPHVGGPEELMQVASRLLEGEGEDALVARESVVRSVIPYLDGAKRAARLIAAYDRGRTDAKAGESR
jgi:hypothetical protein